MTQNPKIKTLYDRTMRCDIPGAPQVNDILAGYPGPVRQERALATAQSVKRARSVRIQLEGQYGSAKRDARAARRAGTPYRVRQAHGKGRGVNPTSKLPF